jgi:MYXO-CTERM domain-containing protein
VTPRPLAAKKKLFFFPLLGALLAGVPAQAYVRSVNGNQVHIWWGGTPRGHSFQIDAQGTPDPGGPGAFAAIRASLQTWANVTCSDLQFPEEALSTDPKLRLVGYFQGQANHNLVLFRTQACRSVVPAGDACFSDNSCSNKYDCWDKGDGVIATTTTTSISSTGEIEDSDTEFNDAPPASGSRFVFTTADSPRCMDAQHTTGCAWIDIQNTMTHEAGHTVGLDHPPDHPEATMYATAPPGETSKRLLAQDDIDGLCSIYPKGKPTVTDQPLTQGSGGGCSSSPAQTGPGAALAALLLLLQIRRRSSNRPQLAMSRSANPARTPRFHSGSVN